MYNHHSSHLSPCLSVGWSVGRSPSLPSPPTLPPSASLCCTRDEADRQSSVQSCSTSTETVRTVRDGEPRTATSTFTTQLLSSETIKAPGIVWGAERQRQTDKQTNRGHRQTQRQGHRDVCKFPVRCSLTLSLSPPVQFSVVLRPQKPKVY